MSSILLCTQVHTSTLVHTHLERRADVQSYLHGGTQIAPNSAAFMPAPPRLSPTHLEGQADVERVLAKLLNGALICTADDSAAHHRCLQQRSGLVVVDVLQSVEGVGSVSGGRVGGIRSR